MKSPTPDKEEQEEVIPLLKRTLALLLLLSMAVLGSGCGLLTEESQEKVEADKPKEPKVAKITFGDYPEDDSIKGLIKTRSHFGKDEDISLSFKLPKGQKLDTKILKIKVLKQPGEKLIEEFNTDELDPSWKGLKLEFTSNSDFHGFYDPGDYKIQVLRGEDLLAEGTLTIVDQ
jgi:hypothetical protein